MDKKKAKLIFKHNYFEIVEDGDYVLCAISGKKIFLMLEWAIPNVRLYYPD